MTDRKGLLVPAAALLALAVPAVVAWSALLGGFTVAVVPIAALAAPALAGARPGRRAAGALAVWLLAAPLFAAVPVDQLGPAAWPALPGELAGGVRQLAVPGVAAAGDDPWPLAAGLLIAGTAWIAAAALVRRRAGVAFAVGAAPWVAAVLLDPAHATVWQGAAVMLAALLLHAWPRTSARTAVALAVVVALASGITAQAVAPQQRWFDAPWSHGHALTPVQLLATEPTFERLTDRPKGAPMLEIKAGEPALWRMQALDVFDGQAWRVSSRAPRLPEPAARSVRVDVRVRGLRNDLVASPGSIDHVDGGGTAHAVSGEAWRLAPRPQVGDRYSVDARVVRPTAAELRRAPPLRDPRVAAYTHLGWDLRRSRHAPAVLHIGPFVIPLPAPGFGDAEPHGFPIEVPLFGHPLDARTTAALDRTPYGRVAALARRLASGAGTEWQVVARVMHYLMDSRRFRYTTDVSAPGPYPLVDFLLRTHAGYCQHFAGAAALLLRLAGVPTRMVAGFATGVRRGGRYQVRDVDAHDWIEVYFAGYGWVPFNPTPAGDPAVVAPELNLLADDPGRSRLLGSRAWVIIGVVAAVALAGWRGRRRPDMGQALARLLGPSTPPSTTLGELGDELARTVGPHTSALAAEAERARFARRGAAPRRWARARIVVALARDLGTWRAALRLARAAAVGPRAGGGPTSGAAPAGARASQHAARSDIA